MNMSESTESKMYCCNFCKCVEDNKHIFKNNALINRIHKCKFVDILMEAQYIEMSEIIKLRQTQTYNKYIWKSIKMILNSTTNEINQKEKHIIRVRTNIH